MGQRGPCPTATEPMCHNGPDSWQLEEGQHAGTKTKHKQEKMNKKIFFKAQFDIELVLRELAFCVNF